MTLEEMRIEKIPSVPEVLVTLLNLCHKPSVEFDELARVIEKEPSLAAKILQIANSAFYRQWSEVTQIRRLLVVLGLDSVKQLAVTSAVEQFFSHLSPRHDTFTTSVWVRSLLCGRLARDLARLTGYLAEDEAYLAGLLHRIGQLVLLQNFPEKYRDILFMDDADAVIEQTERSLFGASYGEVGATLLRRWPIHPFVADAVLYQNLPQAALQESSPLVKLLNLANRLTQGVVNGPAQLLAVQDQLFGLNASLLTEVFRAARATVIEMAQTFGLNAEPYLGHMQPDRLAAAAADRQSARQQLADHVHRAALLGGAQTARPAPPGRKEALQRMRQDLALVFALSDVEFLLCDDTGQRLTGVADDARRPGCAELAIPLRESACLPAQALRQGAPLCSLEALEQAPTAIIDEQLRHLLAAEGLLCLPLIADHRPVGVAMAGVSRQHWQSLANQRDLLKLFARQLARFLDHASQALRAQRQQLDEQRDGQRLEIRKLLHEINNPLAIVTNYLHILALKLGEENPAAGEIAILKEEIVRIGDLLARLGNLDGQPPTEGGPLQLNRIVSDLFKLFDQSLFLSRGIRAELELDEEIPPLALSSGALRQVIVNLVKNAAEAMPEGGVLRLTTRDRVHKNGALFVELQIRDSGPGLPEEVLAVLFTPVASTKPGHSGLGLTIVKNLLDRLSAEISCSSTPTAGTRFQILLPRVVVPGGNVDG